MPENNIRVFRNDTSRPRIAYSVIEYNRDNEGEEVEQLVEIKKEEYPVPRQIVIYYKKVE